MRGYDPLSLDMAHAARAFHVDYLRMTTRIYELALRAEHGISEGSRGEALSEAISAAEALAGTLTDAIDAIDNHLAAFRAAAQGSPRLEVVVDNTRPHAADSDKQNRLDKCNDPPPVRLSTDSLEDGRA